MSSLVLQHRVYRSSRPPGILNRTGIPRPFRSGSRGQRRTRTAPEPVGVGDVLPDPVSVPTGGDAIPPAPVSAIAFMGRNVWCAVRARHPFPPVLAVHSRPRTGPFLSTMLVSPFGRGRRERACPQLCSSSLKFNSWIPRPRRGSRAVSVERIGGQALCTYRPAPPRSPKFAEPIRDHGAAIERVMRWLVRTGDETGDDRG